MTDDPSFAATPEPPDVAFLPTRRLVDERGHADAVVRREAAARAQPGFWSLESVRRMDGFGITVSRWRTGRGCQVRRRHSGHRPGQVTGRARFHADRRSRAARVAKAWGPR